MKAKWTRRGVIIGGAVILLAMLGWRLRPIPLLFAFQMFAAAFGQEAKSITEAESVIAIYTDDLARHGYEPKLVVCIWGDGSIVWSEDNVHGGQPYFTAKVSPKVVSATLKRLVDIGTFDVPRLKEPNLGPDSKYTRILVRTGGLELIMDSWHEFNESNGNVSAAGYGLTGIEGKKLLQVLAELPGDSLHYRMTWSELRLTAANLIPKSGAEAVGVPTMIDGKLWWDLKQKRTK